MKNKYILIGVIILLILAGGWYFMVGSNKSQTATSDSMMKKQDAQSGSQMTSLTDLLSMGKNQACTFSYSKAETGSSQGTAYISGKKIATSFSTTTPDGKKMTGNMINDGMYMYTWTSDTKQGYKIPITESMQEQIEDAKNNPEQAQKQYMDPNAKIEYNCSGWNVDESTFTPPSDITFMELGDTKKMMEQVQQGSDTTGDVKAQQCAACDSVPGESKAACKQALGCN